MTEEQAEYSRGYAGVTREVQQGRRKLRNTRLPPLHPSHTHEVDKAQNSKKEINGTTNRHANSTTGESNEIHSESIQRLYSCREKRRAE